MGGSSSHRRKARARPHRPSAKRSAAVPVPPTQRTLNFDNLAISSGRGYDLLLKSGWSPGSTLGPSPAASPTAPPASSSLPSTPRTPLTTPLPITLRRGRAGLGVALPAPDPAPATPPQQLDHVDHSPHLVRSLAALSVFDPLRPRCQYDASHVVRDLKALRKHELSCPANPARRATHQQHQHHQLHHPAHPAFASTRAQAALSAAIAEGHAAHDPHAGPNFAALQHAHPASSYMHAHAHAFAAAALDLDQLSDSELSDSEMSSVSDGSGDDEMHDVEAAALRHGANGANDADADDVQAGENDSDSESDSHNDSDSGSDNDAMHACVPDFRLART